MSRKRHLIKGSSSLKTKKNKFKRHETVRSFNKAGTFREGEPII